MVEHKKISAPWRATTLYFRGFTYQEIADKLCVSNQTVRNHMAQYRQEQAAEYETHAQLLGKRVAEFERFLLDQAPPSILHHFHTLFGNAEGLDP